jgi:putative mycofactocin binding protein MftB
VQLTSGDTAEFDPDRPARLHPRVALRHEPFGALAYHYDSRRLVFVKTAQLVGVLEDLAQHRSARAAVTAHVPEAEVDGYVAALATLHAAGVVDGR